MMAAIQGIFVPNIVPYDVQGRIAEDELRRIIRWLVGKGVTGFYPNGSTGEFIRLSYEEWKGVWFDCPRVVGSKDTSTDLCRFQQLPRPRTPVRGQSSAEEGRR